MLLDSNIFIYAAKPGGESLQSFIEHPEACTSVLAKIETLGFKDMSAEEAMALETALNLLPLIPVSVEIADEAIKLRKDRKIDLADAIFAATAILESMPLVTRNDSDFKGISGLRGINPYLPAA